MLKFISKICFLIMVIAGSAYGAELTLEGSFLIGHNVTPTTETPRQGVGTVGNYALGWGLTDNLFLATSPWIWVSYNTANLHLKWAKNVSQKSRFGVFASYFESYNSEPFLTAVNGSNWNDGPGGNGPGGGGPPGGGPGGGGGGGGSARTYAALSRYQWQSASVHFLYSYAFNPDDKIYFNLHYGYFWNDEFPYSIRMDPGTDTIREQIDLTALTSVRMGDSDFHWLFEFGGLGLNYWQPYMQLGSSIAYKSASWLVQLGASYTIQFSEINKKASWTPGRYDSRLHYSNTEGRYYYYRYLQTALHPEVQLQYFF